MSTLKELKRAKTDFVFTTHKGEPYTYPTIWKRAWDTAVRKVWNRTLSFSWPPTYVCIQPNCERKKILLPLWLYIRTLPYLNATAIYGVSQERGYKEA